MECNRFTRNIKKIYKKNNKTIKKDDNLVQGMDKLQENVHKILQHQRVLTFVLVLICIIVWVNVPLCIYETLKCSRSSDLDQFRIIYHGDYRIFHGYLPSRVSHTGNSSVTLVLHADYYELSRLPLIVSR